MPCSTAVRRSADFCELFKGGIQKSSNVPCKNFVYISTHYLFLIFKRNVLKLHIAEGRTFSVKKFASEKSSLSDSSKRNYKSNSMIFLKLKLESKRNPTVLTELRCLALGQRYLSLSSRIFRRLRAILLPPTV
jgi:hypothetical protein